jgi:CRISPR/Cas system-associated exonuclease Cas4 (RecB family)
VDKDRQLTIYAMASRWSLGIDLEKLSLYFLEGNLKLSTQRTEETLKEEREKLREIIEKIKTSKFEATPGFPSPCGWCDYNKICPFAKKA